MRTYHGKPSAVVQNQHVLTQNLIRQSVYVCALIHTAENVVDCNVLYSISVFILKHIV